MIGTTNEEKQLREEQRKAFVTEHSRGDWRDHNGKRVTAEDWGKKWDRANKRDVAVGRVSLTALPRAPLPEGWGLFHNGVVPRRKLGASGFRAWVAPIKEGQTPCDCGWPTTAGRVARVHYRGGTYGGL